MDFLSVCRRMQDKRDRVQVQIRSNGQVYPKQSSHNQVKEGQMKKWRQPVWKLVAFFALFASTLPSFASLCLPSQQIPHHGQHLASTPMGCAGKGMVPMPCCIPARN